MLGNRFRQFSLSFALSSMAVFSVWLSAYQWTPMLAFGVTGIILLWFVSQISQRVAFWFWAPSVVSINLLLLDQRFPKSEIADHLQYALWLLASLVAVASATYAYRKLKSDFVKQRLKVEAQWKFFQASIAGSYLVGLTLVPAAVLAQFLYSDAKQAFDFTSTLKWNAVLLISMPISFVAFGLLVGCFGAIIILVVKHKKLMDEERYVQQEEAFLMEIDECVSQNQTQVPGYRIGPPGF